MKNINLENNNGVRHAYAYGHARKETAANFKNSIKTTENKSEIAKTFKDAILSAQIKPEAESNIETVEE